MCLCDMHELAAQSLRIRQHMGACEGVHVHMNESRPFYGECTLSDMNVLEDVSAVLESFLHVLRLKMN